MSDSESIKKMLRSVLQSSKAGVSVSNLQSEYRSLCGESIPLKKLGFSKLEEYLQSIPSVVRLEYRMGELKCFAAVCRETAHIAELVARQKTSKKSGHSQVVNCRMRFKPSNPYMLNVTPRSSLRQPSAGGFSKWTANRSRTHGGYRGFSASGDYRQLDQKLSSVTPVEHRAPASQQVVKQPNRKEKGSTGDQRPPETSLQQTSRLSHSQSALYDMDLEQSRLTQVLGKHSSGLWMSKLPVVYSKMFSQQLHPQVLIDLEKWTHVCLVEQLSIINRADRLIYPPLPLKPSIVSRDTNAEISNNSSTTTTTPFSSCASIPEKTPATPPVPKPRIFLRNPLAKPTFVFPPQSVASGKVSSPVPNPAPQLPLCAANASGVCGDHNLHTTTPNNNKNTHPLPSTVACPAASSLHPGPDVLTLLKATFCPQSDSAPCAPPRSAMTVSDDVRQRIKELLSMYSNGLWVHALPKLFLDTYKMPFPEHVLDNLSLLMDICTVEYPIPHDKKKAILYNSGRGNMEETDGQESQQCRSHPLPSGFEVVGPVVPPCLVFPSEQYPSVLVTDAKSSNAVTVRYVGSNYSHAQEAMEDTMRSFYSQSLPTSNLVVGQLVAVRGEEGGELARAQVMEVLTPNKVKVYYVDHGFSVETGETNLLELHQDFLSLPFQATNVRLAGLETFSSHPLVLSTLDKLAIGKILLMETLEPCQQNAIPVAVLYDTSQDEDLNINSSCLKALQDETMNNPLTVNVTYQDVCVTNVCSDGIIYCQLPSRGTARLAKLLEETEAFFISQMTSESLVSRPFSGKFCLARYKGKWSRVEISTNLYGNRVIEVLFIDFGVPATIEVTELREIPPLLLKDFTIIPPQAIRCCLADLRVPEEGWRPEAFLWVKKAVLGSEASKMKILKLDEHKGGRLVYMYLFIGADSQEPDKSINHQLAQSDLWHKLTAKDNTVSNNNVDTGLSALVAKLTLSCPAPGPAIQSSSLADQGTEDSSSSDVTTDAGMKPLPLPPPLELPQPGQSIDVFVPVACHPGYFVLQPWQDLHKLVVLMGEMALYYNRTWKITTPAQAKKGQVYAAKVDKNWHRVQVKGILSNDLVSIYELDHGKHELVRSTVLRPLIEEFRQLSFQAITAQLAGLSQYQWSEEASMVFRNHVERRALVAQVESVQEGSEVKDELWERKLAVFLVDTTMEDRDLWIHSIMADIGGELSSAA